MSSGRPQGPSFAPKKILAIKLRALGDTVLMTAPLAELRAAYPEARIDVVVTAPYGELLKLHPSVDKVWTYERHQHRASRAKAIASLAIKVRRERYDWAVNFHASPSSSVLALATGARARAVHYHGHRDRNRHSTVVIPGKGTLKPVIERDMDTLRGLGLHVPAGRLPRLYPQTTERDAARRLVDRLGFSGKPVLGLGLGASRPTKCWPIERFAALALEWARSTGGGVVAVLGPGEKPLEETFLKAIDELLRAEVPNAEERAKYRGLITSVYALPLRELAAFLGELAVFAGNDSGPRHLAVALEKPTVTLFGPEDPFEWHPYPQDLHPRFFVEGLPCRRDALAGMPPWCGLERCAEEQHRCLREFGVAPVFEECRRVAQLSS